jgi:starch-binding outer membrane protein, SusD/RagB family
MLHFKNIVNMKNIVKTVHTIIRISIFSALFIISGCDDFLEKPLQGKLTQESFPTTPADALQATNAIYNILRDGSYHQGTFPILDIMSDDAYKGSNPTDAAATVGPYNTFTYIPTETNISSWWSVLYKGVRRANVVIEKVPAIGLDETTRGRYIGEAKFLRALFYFDLVRAWGDVPLVTGTNPETNLDRTAKSAIYDLIENDLLQAIDVLQEKSEQNPGDIGRATKGAAKALLAKVHLFQQDFVNAEKYALEVINSHQYGLEPNFADANSKQGEFGVESVFEIGAIGFEGIENGGNQYANVQGVRGTPNRGWGFNRPSVDLMNTFELNDPRKDATIIFLGETLDGVLIAGDGTTPDETRDNNGNLLEMECYNQKVWTPGINVPTQFDHNRRLLRYADVLLMAAEALNENNKPAQALEYLNDVRERARGGNTAILPDVVETSKDVLRDIILHERRVELALEGHRFWDLVRTGKAPVVLGPLGFQQNKHELLPISQTEQDLTGNRWPKNPGWE